MEAESYRGVLAGVVLRDGDVVVGDFGGVGGLLLSVPHNVVQVGKVMIEVDSFKVVASVCPASQL